MNKKVWVNRQEILMAKLKTWGSSFYAELLFKSGYEKEAWFNNEKEAKAFMASLETSNKPKPKKG